MSKGRGGCVRGPRTLRGSGRPRSYNGQCVGKLNCENVTNLKTELEKHVEREAMLCPEDVGFVEYTKVLQTKNKNLQAALGKRINDEIQALIEKYGDPQYKTNEFALYDVISVAQQLQAELEKVKKTLKILSPYHRKTNPEGRMEAIESSVKFIENKFVKHDSGAISDCVRCNAVSLAGWMTDIIKALKVEKGE